MLRHEHRHLEQGLALLEAEYEACSLDLATLVSELTAHLATEEHIFYPQAEETLGRPLQAQREQHARVRAAMAQASSGARAKAPLGVRLLELTETFREHARLEERALHPTLEGVMSEGALESLGDEMAVFRAAVAATLAGGQRPRSG
jgi:hypothetical protein